MQIKDASTRTVLERQGQNLGILESPECVGSPSGGSGKEPPRQCGSHKTQVQSLGQQSPLGKETAAQPAFLSGKPHGQKSLAGYSPWGHKESDRTKRLNTTPPPP